MAAYNKFNSFVEALAEGSHNLQADALKVMLTNSAPSAANTASTDIAEITAGHGYSAGGAAATVSSSAQTGGTYKLVLADVTITASGGTIGPFRYAVLYNSTSGKLIGWYDYGSAQTLNDTDQLIVDFDGANGVLTIT